MSVVVLILFIIVNIYLIVAGRRHIKEVVETINSNTETQELGKAIIAAQTIIIEEIHVMFIFLFVVMLLIQIGL